MSIQELDDMRARFVTTLDADVKSLVRLHEKDEKGPGRPGEWLRAIRRSAVVLTGANLENFIESIVCAGLKHLARIQVKARKYPEGFRIWRFRHTVYSKNWGLDNANELAELSLILYSEVRELKEDELLLDEMKEKFANPTPENVNWIMRLLDRPDYLSEINVKVDGVHTAAVSALHELARRRNAIAHGDPDEDPDLDDVKRLSKFARTFSTRVKRDVTSAIEKCI